MKSLTPSARRIGRTGRGTMLLPFVVEQLRRRQPDGAAAGHQLATTGGEHVLDPVGVLP